MRKVFNVSGYIHAPGTPLTAPNKFDRDTKPLRRQVRLVVDEDDAEVQSLLAAVDQMLLLGKNEVILEDEEGLQVKASCKNALRGRLVERLVEGGEVNSIGDERLRDFKHGTFARMQIAVDVFTSGGQRIAYARVLRLGLVPRPLTAAEVRREEKRQKKAKREKLQSIYGRPRGIGLPPDRDGDPEEVDDEKMLARLREMAEKNRIDWIGRDGNVFDIYEHTRRSR